MSGDSDGAYAAERNKALSEGNWGRAAQMELERQAFGQKPDSGE